MLVVTASLAAVLTQFSTAGLTVLMGELKLAISLLATAVVPGVLGFVLFLPETRGRALEQLDHMADDEAG